MFCPKCEKEYEEDVYVCSKCGVSLVQELLTWTMILCWINQVLEEGAISRFKANKGRKSKIEFSEEESYAFGK